MTGCETGTTLECLGSERDVADVDKRVIGTYGGQQPGPSLVVIGAIHGNEPAGAQAAERVLATLRRTAMPMRGRLCALVGNVSALQAGQRFLKRDLNRIWSADEIQEMRARDPGLDGPEQAEQRALESSIEPFAHGDDPCVILDLHSTSATGAPFSVMSDTLQNRELTFAYPIPIILGLEEVVRATLLEYYSEMGHVCVAVEGGQHDDPRTVDHHEAILWMTLVSSGMLESRHVPGWEDHVSRLEVSSAGLPSVVETMYRHAIAPEDDFRMELGFENFDPIKRGQRLASDRHGVVHAPDDGRVMLPLYQGQGEDGFFVGREVRVFWLQLSALLRRLGVERLLPLFPGVRRDPVRPRTLLADRLWARWLVPQIFHLLGFRRDHDEDRFRVFVRRPDRRA